VADDASIEAFARRIAPADADPQLVAEMVESIRAANPGVDPDALAPGTLLFVPNLQATEGRNARVAAGLIGTLRSQLETVVTELKMLAEKQLSLANTQEQQMTEALAGNKVQVDAGRVPAIADAVAALQASIKNQPAVAKAQSDAIDNAADEWLSQFKRLAGA
jgi:flagellar biosynthesis chaperone FliJ